MPTFGDIARACSGIILRGKGRAGRRPAGISTDTRSLRRGELFVALKGERHDGHDFLRQALDKGASGLLLSAMPASLAGLPDAGSAVIIKVSDTLRALQEVSMLVRQGSACVAIGITGSCGKTTTKDFLHSILGRRHSVVASLKSHNNEVGVPLTLLRLRPDTEFALVEMGSRGPGHLSELARLVKPSLGVITNIGRAHLKTFGDLRGVMRAKGELLRALPPEGTAVLNADDAFFRELRALSPCPVISFGTAEHAEVRAADIRSEAGGAGVSFVLSLRGGDVRRVRMSMPGRHMVSDALAAAAAAEAVGADPDEIEGGLMNAVATEWRMEMVRMGREITVLNDSYNANPESMRAALEAMRDMARTTRAIAVLGDMAELGEISEEAHREVGRMAVDCGIDIIIAVGRRARSIARAARESGLPKGSVFTTAGVDEAAAILRAIMEPGDVVLIKGSRFMGMEKLLDLVA